MKTLTTVILILVFNTCLLAQDITEQMGMEACNCIEIATIARADSCITSAMAKVVSATGNKEEARFLGTVEGIRGTIKKVQQFVQENCSSSGQQALERRKDAYYRKSENKRAAKLYKKGTGKLQEGNYKKAAKDFKKALRIDPEFIIAIDHLAVCYRQMQQFDKAIALYEQSLALFPEGDLALQNLAVVYSLKKDHKTAINYYTRLKNLYPDNPEGYFGLAKEFLIIEEMEEATENALVAYVLYQNSGSRYLQDGEQLIGMVYKKLKDQNRTELLNEKAKELNITLTIN